MKRRQDLLEKLQKSQEESRTRHKQLLEEFRTKRSNREVSRSSIETERTCRQGNSNTVNFEVEKAISSAKSLHLMAIDESLGLATPLNWPTVELLREFLQTLATGESTIVLQWPLGQEDMSLLHPLAMLTLICTPDVKKAQELVWCDEPTTFRTLYFPWCGGTTTARQARLLVRRDEVLSWNRFHLARSLVNKHSSDDILDSLHLTIGNLRALEKRERSKPHLAHPTLAEIFPVFIAEENDAQGQHFGEVIGELFGRVRFGAKLHILTDHRPKLSEPHIAPYGLFGVSPSVIPREVLASTALSSGYGMSPDICLLDLGTQSLNRLGSDWERTIRNFVVEARKRFPDLPLMGVTQDPYVNTRLINVFHKVLGKSMTRSRVIVRMSDDPLSTDEPKELKSGIKSSFTTYSGPTVDALIALSKAARGTSDPMLVSRLRRVMGSLRKAANLPCGLGLAYKLLCEEIGQDAAETFLEHCSRGTLLAPLEYALNSIGDGTERTRLLTASEAVRIALDNLDTESPIGSLFTDLATTVLTTSDHTVVVFATDIDLKLGIKRFANDTEFGRAMCEHIDKDKIVLFSVENLDSKLADMGEAKDYFKWKRLILIAPNLDLLSRVVTMASIPNELIVLCDQTLAVRVAKIFQLLSSHPELKEYDQLAARLAALAEAARLEVKARDTFSIDLNLESLTATNGVKSIIDLTEDDSGGGDKIRVLTLASGRTLRARLNTIIVRYNRNAPINSFETARARDVCLSDSVVVPNENFIEEAREVLPLRVLSQNWVDVYHTTVEAHVDGIPGNTLNAKARKVLSDIQALGARTQSHAAVLNWLKVKEYTQLPREIRQPHAPQRLSEFNAFMKVLGINEEVAKKMWTEGIQPLRINRRRAGLKMAQAFISVLVDPHGTVLGFDESVRKGIEVLRKKALDHLDQVVSIETIGMRAHND